MAEQRGASALLVFPSQVFSMGGQLRPEMAIAHFKTIADATDLPIIVFDVSAPGNIRRVFSGEPIGTLVHAHAKES